jgi:two-component system response regulator YesN
LPERLPFGFLSPRVRPCYTINEKAAAMLKLVIVDDEKTTRESLAEYIPWNALNIDSVRTARNGAEALGLIEQDPPDILITDVRMPKMDGLELAERVRNSYPACKIIFLSGYADKEYLKKAIHLQAISYIEKPIDPHEVEEVTRTAVCLHQEETRRKEEADRIRAAALENKDQMREKITRMLVSGETGTDTLRQTYRDTLPALPPECCCTASALVLRWSRTLPEGEKEAARRRILRIFGEYSPFNLPSSFLGFTDAETMAVVVAGRIIEESPRGRGMFRDFLETVKNASAGRFTGSIGIGNPVKDLKGLPRSFDSALQAASLSFYRGPWQVLFPAEEHPDKFSPEPDLFVRFQELLDDDDGEQAAAVARQLAEQARRQEALSIDSVRNAFFKLFLAITEVAWEKKFIDPFGDEEWTYIWQEVRERPSLAELLQFICTNIEALFGNDGLCSKSPRKIAEIRRYIRRNYAAQGLSLQSIAEHTGLSRTYLSFLFKDATGGNLNEYITHLRIQKAKELLLDPRMKTYEVAARVGYQDANYFSTIFKKYVGVTPTEYRERG